MAFTKALSTARLCVLLTLCFGTVAVVEAQWPALIPLQLKPSGSHLGLKLVDIDEDRAKVLRLAEPAGVEITAVEEGAAADQAGVRPGDVILTYNGEKILGSHQFIRLVAETPPGRRVRLLCSRVGVQKELSLVTGSPNPPVSPEEVDLAQLRVTDVPSPLMLWRNLVLGIDSQEINEQLDQAFGVKQGILVWNVTPSYPAQRAGLRAGDVVTGFCGRPVHSPRELGLIMQQLQGGQKPISVQVVRDHKTMSILVSLNGER